jgi:hypothetical protein
MTGDIASKLLKGKPLADRILADASRGVQELKARGIHPCLCSIEVGFDPASRYYLENQRRIAERVGIKYESRQLNENIYQEDMLKIIEEINLDPYIHGLIINLPLPQHLKVSEMQWKISSAKDVEGVTPHNMGALFLGAQGLKPCTALAITELIKSTGALFLCSGKRGLVKSFNILVPVKLVLLLIISGYAALLIEKESIASYSAFLIPQQEGGWLIASVLYVAYNFALAMVILTEYQSLGSRRDGIWGAIWGGILLGILILFNYMALNKFLPVVLHYQVPMLYVAGDISPISKGIYTMVLWVGILTTAIANAYGFAQRFCHFTGISYSLSLLLTLILALPIAWQSFSVLVSKVYPLFGLLGIIILLVLVRKAGKEIGADIKTAFSRVD